MRTQAVRLLTGGVMCWLACGAAAAQAVADGKSDAASAAVTLAQAKEQQEAGRFAQAIDGYRAILARDPNQTNARLGLATSLGAAKRTAEALEAFQELLRREPEHARAHLLLGELYLYQQRQYDQALDQFAQATRATDAATRGLALEQAGDVQMLVKRDWLRAAVHAVATAGRSNTDYRGSMASWMSEGGSYPVKD